MRDLRGMESLFGSLPTPTLLLDPDLTITAVNRAYARAVLRSADELIGLPMFEAFPDNPADPAADGVARLTFSLEWAARMRRSHNMVVQRYDIVDSTTGDWVKRVWQPLNSPLIDDGRVVGLAHQVRDITGVEDDVHRVLTSYRDGLADGSDPHADARALAERADAVAALLVQQKELTDEVLHLRRALSSRATIEQAKGMIMADRHCSADDAFDVLVRLSSETRVKVADVALAFLYQAQAGSDGSDRED